MWPDRLPCYPAALGKHNAGKGRGLKVSESEGTVAITTEHLNQKGDTSKGRDLDGAPRRDRSKGALEEVC